MTTRRALLPLSLLTMSLAFFAPLPSASAYSQSYSFFSPSGNLGCQMTAEFVICGTTEPPRMATLSPSGHVSTNTNYGDLPEDSHLLAYGSSHRVGVFRCEMSTSGVRCIVIRTGRGLQLARGGLRIVGSAGIGTGQSTKVPKLTAFGATSAMWEKHHRADTRAKIRGYAYDPTPSLGDEPYDDRYFSLIRESGRVLGYTMRFESGTSISAARAFVLRNEFTNDARVVWFKRHGTVCAEMLVHSNTLNRATKFSAIVVFSSGQDGLSYNPDAISTVVLSATPEPFTGLNC